MCQTCMISVVVNVSKMKVQSAFKWGSLVMLERHIHLCIARAFVFILLKEMGLNMQLQSKH